MRKATAERRIQRAAYYLAHRDEIRAKELVRYAANPEPNRERARRWNLDNPGRAKERDRRTALQNYGVTSEWFRDMLVGQAGRCAICGLVMEPGRKTCIDHDHRTGKARALLCHPCNLMLGLAKDSPATLATAIKYLEAF